MHEFTVTLRWKGSTAGEYTKSAIGSAPGHIDVPTSSAPTYGGSPDHWNPEELFGLALSACHKLTFLALAKKARIDVRAYEDDVRVFLDAVDGVTKITKVRLHPTITVAGAFDEAKAKELFEKAHKYCFVGQSITSETVMEPVFRAA